MFTKFKSKFLHVKKEYSRRALETIKSNVAAKARLRVCTIIGC